MQTSASAAIKDDDPDFSLEETVQFGPVHAAPFFTIRDLGYDDNVRLTDTNETGDWTVTFGPGARAVLPFGRLAALAVREEIDYVAFAGESDLNHVNNDLRAKLHFWLRDVTLSADGEQKSYRERPNDEVDFRLRHIATRGRLGASWKPEGRMRASFHFDRTWQAYDAGQVKAPNGLNPGQTQVIADRFAAILDRLETNAILDLRLKLKSRAWLVLESRTGRIEFERAVPARDSSIQSLMIGIDIPGTGPLRGYAKAGLADLAPDDDAARGFSGWTAEGRLSARLFGRGEVRATYDRRPEFSAFGENLYYLYDQRGLSWEQWLSRALSIEVGRSASHTDYPIPLSFAVPVLREDDITSDTFSIRYRLGPSLRVGLTWNRWHRDSSLDDEDASRNLITTLVEYTP